MLDVNCGLKIFHQKKWGAEKDHPTMSIPCAVELYRKVAQFSNAWKPRRDDLMFCPSRQFATAVAHKNNHVEDFFWIFLQAAQTHAIATWIDSRLVMNRPLDTGHRFDESVL